MTLRLMCFAGIKCNGLCNNNFTKKLSCPCVIKQIEMLQLTLNYFRIDLHINALYLCSMRCITCTNLIKNCFINFYTQKFIPIMFCESNSIDAFLMNYIKCNNPTSQTILPKIVLPTF